MLSHTNKVAYIYIYIQRSYRVGGPIEGDSQREGRAEERGRGERGRGERGRGKERSLGRGVRGNVQGERGR